MDIYGNENFPAEWVYKADFFEKAQCSYFPWWGEMCPVCCFPQLFVELSMQKPEEEHGISPHMHGGEQEPPGLLRTEGV